MIRYICDPARNTRCDKALCFASGGPCGLTDDVRCAARDLFGNPVRAVDPDTIPMEDNNDFAQKKKYGR